MYFIQNKYTHTQKKVKYQKCHINNNHNFFLKKKQWKHHTQRGEKREQMTEDLKDNWGHYHKT